MVKPVDGWTDFQDMMDAECARLGADPDASGHGRWWRDFTYDDFKNNKRKVKGQQVVVVGDPDKSVLIHALEGTGDFVAGGRFQGRMPLDSGPFDPDAIAGIRDWIKRGCPEHPSPSIDV